MAFGDVKPSGLESMLPIKGPKESIESTFQAANLEASYGVGKALSVELTMYDCIIAAL